MYWTYSLTPRMSVGPRTSPTLLHDAFGKPSPIHIASGCTMLGFRVSGLSTFSCIAFFQSSIKIETVCEVAHW